MIRKAIETVGRSPASVIAGSAASVITASAVTYGLGLGRPVATAQDLGKIGAGATTARVVEVLGEPAVVTRGYRDYERPLNPGWVRVTFDDGGRVASVVDGSVHF